MAASGGYLEGTYQVSFVTPTDKRIDVDISEQKLRLYEGEEMVREFVVATGVTGADTPIGEFKVEYKMESARFRGTNPSGHTYDLPNVKWVLAFQGDYTIHGSYWRTVYGRPASNGCVSMTDANALEVFQWAPEGTPISIHE
jgi:lipoprotein-anchoring transpeptidase ErfK/SrfK